MQGDTQPTKFCVECRWCRHKGATYLCTNEQVTDKENSIDIVTGEVKDDWYVLDGKNIAIARNIRTRQCKGQWWEPPLPRPSIFQRIKRWFG